MNIPERILIRPSTEADMPAIVAIYAHHVLHGTGTFATEPPSLEEMTGWRADVLARKLPWLVICRGLDEQQKVLGYVEDSIYMAPEAAGQGLGKLLLTELLAQLERGGIRKAMAVIGDSANLGSIGVHRACGFVDVGIFKSCGWKFGAWRDIVLMEKTLGTGDTTSPE
jgi:L-amino acid N-acyltransferase YncA